MAEFGDFELNGGERKATPGGAASVPAVPSQPAGPNAAMASPGARRGRLSSLAAPAVILAAAAAILSARPPEPTWTVGDPSQGPSPESTTTQPLVLRVSPLPETGAAPTSAGDPVRLPPSAPASTETPLELLTAADALPSAATPPAETATATPPVAPLVPGPPRPAPLPPPGGAAPIPAPAPAVAEVPTQRKPAADPAAVPAARVPPPVAATPTPTPAPQPAARPFTVSVPHDPIKTRLAMTSILAEARRKEAEVAQAAALRDAVPELERQRMAMQMLSEREEADQRRTAFRRELAEILQRDGDKAAPAIWALVESQGKEPSPAVERAIAQALAARKGRLDRDDRVAIFRSHGLDEAVIFTELYREQVAMMPARRGPRTREDAVVRAARALLAIPPREATDQAAVRP